MNSLSWLFKGSQYTQLPTHEHASIPSDYAKKTFDFNSIFDFETKANSKNFRTVFKFDKTRDTMEADYYKYIEGENSDKSAISLVLLSFLLTSASYLLLFLGFPILYWFCIIHLGESDRMVVFRLGKMSGVKGPGRVIIFPWMDQYKRVDVGTSAFSVPPQQFISQDGGIIEMGADIQYLIVDVETMVKEVADYQDILRSLGRTLMTKILTKKTVGQLIKDRRMAAEDIQNLMNEQVRKWGIDTRQVTLSDPKVLKKPEGKSALNPILQNLGLRDEKEFPSPQQFVQMQFTGENDEDKDPNADAINTLAGAVSGYFSGNKGASATTSSNQFASVPPCSSQFASMPAYNASNFVSLGSGPAQFASVPSTQNYASAMPTHTTKAAPTKLKAPPGHDDSFWRSYLQGIVSQEGLQLEPEAMGLYQLIITGSPIGEESLIIDVSPGCNVVKRTREHPHLKPHVQVTLDSNDLLAVIQGSLAPLQAYLTGRISATGDVKKMMFFDKISRMGHKPGAMFNI